MRFRIYYTDKYSLEPKCSDETTLNGALSVSDQLRRVGHLMVTMVSDNRDMVGEQGVSGVVEGKLPDGTDYSWTKNDRVGAAFKNK